ncbi:hypothetical protein ACMC9M_20425 [Pseudomonadota bacterium 24LQ007]
MKKALLLGAGFSYDLGMPIASELTEIFLSVFSNKHANKRFVENLALKVPYGEDRPINKKALSLAVDMVVEYRGENYEELLSTIQNYSKRHDITQSDRDTFNYIFQVFYTVIHEILNLYQLTSYPKVYLKNAPCFKSLRALLSDSETWVFTLNHDMYFECLALDYKIPITYGDEHNISFPLDNKDTEKTVKLTYSIREKLYESSGFFQDEFGVNLVKLHGGLSELEYRDGSMLCNQSLSLSNGSPELMHDFIQVQSMAHYIDGQKVHSGRDRVITNADGELDIICQSMLTGGSKYSLTTNEKSGEEKLGLLSRKLNEVDELTIIGYGFGDKHVNYRLSNAMVLNERLKIIIVDAVAKPIPEILEQFNYDSRIIRSTCGAAPWMGYLEKHQKWDSEQMKILEGNARLREEVKDLVKMKFAAKD